MGEGLCVGEGVCAVASLAWLLACAALNDAALTVPTANTKNTRSRSAVILGPVPQRRRARGRAGRDRARDLILRAPFSAGRSGRMWSPCSQR